MFHFEFLSILTLSKWKKVNGFISYLYDKCILRANCSQPVTKLGKKSKRSILNAQKKLSPFITVHTSLSMTWNLKRAKRSYSPTYIKTSGYFRNAFVPFLDHIKSANKNEDSLSMVFLLVVSNRAVKKCNSLKIQQGRFNHLLFLY